MLQEETQAQSSPKVRHLGEKPGQSNQQLKSTRQRTGNLHPAGQHHWGRRGPAAVTPNRGIFQVKQHSCSLLIRTCPSEAARGDAPGNHSGSLRLTPAPAVTPPRRRRT